MTARETHKGTEEYKEQEQSEGSGIDKDTATDKRKEEK